MMPEYYLNYGKNEIKFNTETRSFSFGFSGRGTVLEAVITRGAVKGEKNNYDDLFCTVSEVKYSEDCVKLTADFTDKTESSFSIHPEFRIDAEGVTICSGSAAAIFMNGTLKWGSDMEKSTFSVNTGRTGENFRTASGPACSTADDALFDRLTDSLMLFTGYDRFSMMYDWDAGTYRFSLETVADMPFSLKIIENYYADKFHIHYKPINKKNCFPAPPVGWMTWYAVKFNACEAAVLENTRFMREKLRDFGANCIWVDWEWYHSNLKGTETDGSDTFHPSIIKYPRGLKAVSDEIKKNKLIPVLWIGATNEPHKNEILEAHPEWVLCNAPRWCGQWWIDISHPEVVKAYIPMVFRQILEWGFEAVKWDCLPATLEVSDKHHEQFHDITKSTEDAFRDVIKSARDTIGENMYMISCSGESYRSITAGMDFFDGARIGGDVFNWEDFLNCSVNRLRKYLVFNNIILHTDPDVVILREEFNTFDQARSRACFISMLGLPYTLGDHLPDLPDDRIEIIRRTIPVLDAHPMDVFVSSGSGPVEIVNLAVSRPFEAWNVVNVFNTSGEEQRKRIDLSKDLYLETSHGEEYLIYEYWNRKLFGITGLAFDVVLPAYATKVFSVRRKGSCPQIVSTSRHITQGATELKEVHWDNGTAMLCGKSETVGGDPYSVYVYVPDGYLPISANSIKCRCVFEAKVLQAEWIPAESGLMDWKLYFIKQIY
ncbi:MAG: glycoside hydrolase family 36 protein [Eubacteriales bacterium]